MLLEKLFFPPLNKKQYTFSIESKVSVTAIPSGFWTAKYSNKFK
jgi:hypothetical protein